MKNNNNNNAFTLIELIATLVIISLITLIVIPLILNTIRKAKEQANRRSIDNYGRIVETAMAEYQSEYLKYPSSIDELPIEYVGSVIECETRRINPDNSIYLSECKVNGKPVKNSKEEDGWYHYGKLILTDKEYVDVLGKNIESALKDYYKENNKYPVNYRLLTLPKLDKEVNCVSDINPNGTVYLTKCSVEGKYILNETEEDGYYHYGKEIPLATKYLLKKTNPITVTNYTDGNTHEMYTFEHESTEQTPALTDYRYIGNDPYNYVTFNDELWRIVGVFKVEDGNGYWEYRVKIVRNEFLSSTKAWGSNNEWSTSSLNTYLNNEYLTSLSVQSQNMIKDATYYLGGRHSISNLSDTVCYNFERSTSVYASDERKLNWSGKFALMYPSDYIYTFALGVDSYCNLNGGNCSIENGGNPSKSWVYNIGGGSKSQWLISQDSSYPIVAYQIYKSGFIDNYNSRSGYARVGGKYYINPALYLSSKVKITSGNGSIDSPYELGL